MSQTVANQYMEPAFAGLENGVDASTIDTYPSAGNIPLGVPVMHSTSTSQTVIAATGLNSGNDAIGFSVVGKHMQTAGGSVDYVAGDPVPVLKLGRVWLRTTKAIQINSLLQIDSATGFMTDTGGLATSKIKARSLISTTSAGIVLAEVYHV